MSSVGDCFCACYLGKGTHITNTTFCYYRFMCMDSICTWTTVLNVYMYVTYYDHYGKFMNTMSLSCSWLTFASTCISLCNNKHTVSMYTRMDYHLLLCEHLDLMCTSSCLNVFTCIVMSRHHTITYTIVLADLVFPYYYGIMWANCLCCSHGILWGLIYTSLYSPVIIASADLFPW